MTAPGGSTAVGSEPLGPMETSVLAMVLFAVPSLLPVAAAIHLGIRLRSHIAAVRGALPS
jgi:hypothetical protein